MTLVALSTQLESYGRAKEKVIYRYPSIVDVFKEWWTDPFRSPLFTVPSICTLGLAFSAVMAAWLLLPNTFRSGSALQAWRAAFEAVLSCVGVLNFLMALLLAGYVTQYALIGQRRELGDFSGVLCVLGIFWAFAFLLREMERATLTLGSLQTREELTLHCEGCGYDLTHQPETGLCSECGLNLSESTSVRVRRQGISWQHRRSLSNWMTSTLRLIFRPGNAYRRMQIHKQPNEAFRFAFFHRAAIAAGAWFWVFCLALRYSEGQTIELVMVPIVVTTIVSLAGWGVHRLVSAVVFTYAVMRRITRDGPASLNVIQYETPFLWAFCVVNGLMLTSFFVFGDAWISLLLTGKVIYFLLGVPIDAWAIFALNAGLLIWWCVRIWKALNAVRWSNF